MSDRIVWARWVMWQTHHCNLKRLSSLTPLDRYRHKWTLVSWEIKTHTQNLRLDVIFNRDMCTMPWVMMLLFFYLFMFSYRRQVVLILQDNSLTRMVTSILDRHSLWPTLINENKSKFKTRNKKMSFILPRIECQQGPIYFKNISRLCLLIIVIIFCFLFWQ